MGAAFGKRGKVAGGALILVKSHHCGKRFKYFARRNFGLAEAPVFVRDWQFADAPAAVLCAPQQFYQEGIAFGANCFGLDGMQHGAAVAAEGGGAVPRLQVQRYAGRAVCGAADGAPQRRAANHLPAGNIARTNHQIMRGTKLQQAIDVARVVRVIRIHRQDLLESACERKLETGDVRRAQPQLCRPVNNLHLRVAGSARGGNRAGAIGRVVIHNDHAQVVRQAAQVCDQARNVFALVIRGNDDGGFHVGKCASCVLRLNYSLIR